VTVPRGQFANLHTTDRQTTAHSAHRRGCSHRGITVTAPGGDVVIRSPWSHSARSGGRTVDAHDRQHCAVVQMPNAPQASAAVAEPLPICYLNANFCRSKRRASRRLTAASSLRTALRSDAGVRRPPVPRRRALCGLTRSLAPIHMGPRTALPNGAASCKSSRRTRGRSMPLLAGHTRRRTRPQPRAAAEIRRTVFLFSAPLVLPTAAVRERGSLHQRRDTRWAPAILKSTALLANVLLRKLSVQRTPRRLSAAQRPFDGRLSSAVHIVKERAARLSGTLSGDLPGTTRSVVERMATPPASCIARSPVSEPSCALADEIGSPAAREICRDTPTARRWQRAACPVWRVSTLNCSCTSAAAEAP